MFKESVRSQPSFRDFDEAENRLATIVTTKVASDLVERMANSVSALNAVIQKRDQELDAVYRSNEDERARICEKYRTRRHELAQQVDDATEKVHQVLLKDNEARGLLEGFSRNSRSQMSAIRDAVHIIVVDSVKQAHTDLDITVEEMAGAKA